MDKNSLVGPFLSHSPSRVYRGDGAIRFSGEARYKYLHVDILYFLLGLHAQMVLLHIFFIRLRPPFMEKEERGMAVEHDLFHFNVKIPFAQYGAL